MNNKPLSKQGGRNKRKKKKGNKNKRTAPFFHSKRTILWKQRDENKRVLGGRKKGEDEKKEENDEPVPVLTNFSFVGMICGGGEKKMGGIRVIVSRLISSEIEFVKK